MGLNAYIMQRYSALTLEASGVVFNVFNGAILLDTVYAPATGNTKTLQDWCTYFKNASNYIANMIYTEEFFRFEFQNGANNIVVAFSENGDRFATYFGFDPSTLIPQTQGVSWGPWRCVLHGSDNNDNGSILDNVGDEELAMGIRTVHTTQYTANSGYKAADDLQLFMFSSRFLLGTKKEWPRIFWENCTGLYSADIELVNFPTYYLDNFANGSDTLFRLDMEKTKRVSIDRFEKSMYKFTIACVEVK